MRYPTLTVVADDIQVLGLGTEDRCMDEAPVVAEKVIKAVEKTRKSSVVNFKTCGHGNNEGIGESSYF